jgi:hypothetical protein
VIDLMPTTSRTHATEHGGVTFVYVDALGNAGRIEGPDQTWAV